MKLLIDNREPNNIIKQIESLNTEDNYKFTIEVKSLDIGDYIIYDDDGEFIKLIIERKSLSDLESSIKDGRYSEQSYRLNNCNTHNHNIIYLIEGNIETYKNANFKSTIYSTIFSLNYFKGFSVICSHNYIETGKMLYNFICKILREKNKKGFYEVIQNNKLEHHDTSSNNTSSNYLDSVKTSKKANITETNILQLMLMQIPGISRVSAKAINEKYSNLSILLETLDTDIESIQNLKLENGRKINKNIVESLKKYLLL
tara:strand:+ start:134 stop:907 length:774 start_codon:yes stop_codon:yes gene_type:complete